MAFPKKETETGVTKSANLGLIISSVIMGLAVLGLVAYFMVPKLVTRPTANWIEGEIGNFCINNVCLTKTDDKWWVEIDSKKVPADTSTVNNFVDDLKRIKLERIVSVNSEKLTEFGFDSTAPTELKVNNQSLLIGDQNSAMDGTYVKKSRENEVYEIETTLVKDKMATPDFWINKKVTEIPVLSIRKIELNNGDKSIEIPTDDKIVTTLASVEATSYIDKPTDTTPVDTYKITTENGEISLFLGMEKQEDGKSIYWASSGDNDYYAIDKKVYDLLTAKAK